MKYTAVIRNLDQAIEWGLYVVIFFLPMSMSVVSIALLACTAMWCGKMLLVRQVKWRRTPLDLPVCAFVICGAVSILGAPDRFISAYNFAYLMGHYVLTYCLITQNITSFAQIKRLFRVLFLSASVTAFYGFHQYFHPEDMSQYRWVDGEQFPDLHARVYSTMENPNIYAGYLVVVIAMALGVLLAVGQWRKKILYVMLILGLSSCLALTYSRGGWVSFLGMLAVLGIVRHTRFLWFLIIGPLLAVWLNPTLLERLVSIVNPVDSSSALRLALWESSLAMLLDHPVFGIGWGTYWLVYPAYDFFINNSETTIYHAHNMFLHIGAELGFLGLGSFIWLLTALVRLTVKLYRGCRRPEVCGVALGLFAAFVALVVNGITDYVLFNIQLSILLWALMGLTIVVHFTEQKNCCVNVEEKQG